VSEAGGVLLEVAVLRDGELSTGLRVHVDGHTEAAADGAWEPVWTYPPEAVAALTAAAAEADDPPLEATYSRPGGVSHPTTVRWRLPGGREIAIERYTKGLVPPLDHLYDRLFQLRPDPAASSLWRVLDGERTVEHRIVGEPAAIPGLAPLVDALFAREPPGDENAPARADSDSPPLVEVRWETEGDPPAQTLVHTDGTWVDVEGAKRTPQRKASPAELQALRAAIAAIDWNALPDAVTSPRTPGV
jgi:hypothetical protein